MHAAVRALLTGIIDYAGMFPPAKLPLDRALENYQEHQKTRHHWMLGNFVCPVGRLRHVTDWLGEAAPPLSILAEPPADAEEFLPRLTDAFDAALRHRPTWTEESVAGIEIPLPRSVAPAALAQPLSAAVAFCRETPMQIWLETPFSPTWIDDVAKLAEELQTVHKRHPSQPFGLKIRCGGTTPEAFPTAERIAFFIDLCRTASLRWKATAGLHHPYPRWDENLQVWQHGFLNVFVAGILARIHALDQPTLVEILADRKGQFFRFQDNKIRWKSWACTTVQIQESRGTFATSFGSCSFEEPVADLLEMGLLDAGA